MTVVRMISLAALLCASLLAGCGGGGNNNSSSNSSSSGGTTSSTSSTNWSYTVGGAVTGLTGTLTLQNNGGDTITLTADGSFAFPNKIVDGEAYAVTVASQPSGQSCVVANGTGSVQGADVSTVTVTCSTATASSTLCTPTNSIPASPALGPALSDDDVSNSIAAIAKILQARTPLSDLQANSTAIASAIQNAGNVGFTTIESDCTVSILLSDGTPLALFDDHRATLSSSGMNLPAKGSVATTSYEATASKSKSLGKSARVKATDASVTAYAIPASLTARIGYADNLASDALPVIKTALESRGYSVSVGMTTTDLRTGMNGVGVVWLSTHGASCRDAKSNAHYCIVADGGIDVNTGKCTLSGAECAANKTDMHADRAVTAISQDGKQAFYMINESFVSQYWRLAAHGLVFIDAANSLGSNEAPLLQNALTATVASPDTLGAILGWTGNVTNTFSGEAVTFFFDRVLGANAYDKYRLTPPQRPFSASEVAQAMAGKNLINDPNNAGTALTMIKVGQEEPILAPSIKNLYVTEAADNSVLSLYGEFPSQQGWVEIEGSHITAVNAWNPSQIDIVIPNSGTGSYGKVQVLWSDGSTSVISNKVPLTSWRGSLTERDTYGAPGPYFEVDCSPFHFRLDVHAFRLAPEQSAAAGTVTTSISADTACTGTAGGSGIYQPGATWTFAETSFSMPWLDFLSAGGVIASGATTGSPFITGFATIDTGNKLLQLQLVGLGHTTLTETVGSTSVVTDVPVGLGGAFEIHYIENKNWTSLNPDTLRATEQFSIDPPCNATVRGTCTGQFDLIPELDSAPTSDTAG